MHITHRQVASASALLGIPAKDVIKDLGLSGNPYYVYLREGKKMSKKNVQRIVDYFIDKGVEFIENGVREAPKGIEFIEGEDCYIKTLKKVTQTLETIENKELLIMFASDETSPPAVNDQYRLMRKLGINMRQLIKEGDTYIMGELEEYRTIPEEQFINIVSLIHDDYVAQVNGDETAVTIYRDARLAARKRADFEDRWNRGKIPETSTAEEKF